MKKRVITISRQFGSGGREIGRQLAKKLGINCYNNDILVELAEKSGFHMDYVKERGEYVKHSSAFLNALNYSRSGFKTNQEYLWEVQSGIIKEIGERENCIIVGRCADYILRDSADLLRVFIQSDMDKRAKRIVDVYGEDSSSPEKILKEKDKRRSNYYHFYTDMQWGDIKNYDLVLNSGVIGIEKCADIIASVYEQ